MKKRDDIQKELEALSPLLAKMKPKNDLEVPANYFDNLTNSILEKTNVPVKGQMQEFTIINRFLVFLKPLFQPRMALVFASLLLLIAVFFTLNTKKNTIVAELTTEDISAYIASNIEDFEDDVLFPLAEETELSFDFFDTSNDAELDILLEDVLEKIDDLDELF